MLSTKSTQTLAGVSLDAAGLVALADLSTISERTALKGSASVLDIFLLAPGLHTQQEASDVNKGEYPDTASMTTGYVFRVENQATVRYLQKVGRTMSLVTLAVEPMANPPLFVQLRFLETWLFGTGIACTVVAMAVLATIGDYWALVVTLMLISARVINTVVIIQRAQMQDKGAKEPGEMGDLLILVSQDRWIRMKGLVDDLKSVTAGQWLRDQSDAESFTTAFATLLVYVSAALAANSSTIGSLCLVVLLLVSAALLGLCNHLTQDLWMYERRVHVIDGPKKYGRRLDMAKEMIEEVGRRDWAESLGLILPLPS